MTGNITLRLALQASVGIVPYVHSAALPPTHGLPNHPTSPNVPQGDRLGGRRFPVAVPPTGLWGESAPVLRVGGDRTGVSRWQNIGGKPGLRSRYFEVSKSPILQ